MRKKIRNAGLKRIITAICAIAVIAAALTYTFTLSRDRSAVYGAEPISASVGIGDNTYTKTEKLCILEIVPDKALAELGYMAGEENSPVEWQDIMAVSNIEERAAIAKEYIILLNQILGSNQVQMGVMQPDGSMNWYTYNSYEYNMLQANSQNYNSNTKVRILDRDGNPYEYLDDTTGETIYTNNIFAYYVFGGYDMCDKISVISKSASEVTVEDIKKSNLIYINSGGHMAGYYNLYGRMAQTDENDKYSVDFTYDMVGQGQDNFNNLSEDLSLTVMWEMYMAVAEETTSLILDNNVRNVYSGNIDKLYTMVMGADKDTFKKDFWSQKDSETHYSGELGTIELKDLGGENEDIVITYKYNNPWTGELENRTIEWSLGCFEDYHFNDAAESDKYYNAGSLGIGGELVNKNVYAYNGNNAMDMNVLDGSLHYYEGTEGTTLDHAYDKYGTTDQWGNPIIKRPDLIIYILGEYKSKQEFTGVMTVLEIEPAGAYKYSEDKLNADSAAFILDYFRYEVKKLNDNNCKEYVDVTSVSINGFIGMSEDIINNYDLVIISDYNEYNSASLINTGITKIYTNQGPVSVLTDYYTFGNGEKHYAALSGNDLTKKAYDKIIDYVKSGKPLVLADSIYSGDKETADENTNLYNLSYAVLSQQFGEDMLNNVTNESNTLKKVLTYRERPEFTISDSLSYKTDENGIAIPNIDKSRLNSVVFSGNVINTEKSYSLNIYVDKDANGFYTETRDDNNELLYQTDKLAVGADGEFSVQLEKLPEELRGYLQWKAVLTDNETGMSCDNEGALVVKYSEDEIRRVKVLQIIPTEDTAYLTFRLDNGKFTELFEQSREITGLEMDLTVMTVNEFEEMFAVSPFSLNSDGYGNTYAVNDALTRGNEKGYDMVVIGFGDEFACQDISNDNGAVDNIKYYIETGNPVLMSHDVLSYNSYSDGGENTNLHVNFIDKVNLENWSYDLTSALRDIIGMDRYGASVGESQYTQYPQGYSNTFLQQRGLSENGEVLRLYGGISLNATQNGVTAKISRLNKGQITQYPYYIGENLAVSETHGQYFQLDLEAQGETEENDVIVWYTLAGSEGSYYDMSGQDALNNYYIYSKGNITYSGAGHSTMDEEGEIKLFVNTFIRAIGSGNNIPSIEYLEPAIETGEGMYEMAVRGETIDTIYFVPHDDDMTKNGTFEEAYVFWDKNGSGLYDQGDILFKEYSNSTGELLINGREYLINLEADYIGETGILADEIKAEIIQSISSNEFKLTIQVSDSKKGVGTSSLNLVSKELFKLN